MATDWTVDHWRDAHDALLASWAQLKGVSLDVARLHWPTGRPPIHRPATSMEAPR